MINSLKQYLFLTVVSCCAAAVFGQASDNIVRLALKDTSHHGPPNTLPVFVEIATVQPDVEQGIVFTINIENNSNDTVRIMDPIDAINIGLIGLARPFCENMQNIQPDYMACTVHFVSSEKRKAIRTDKVARRPFKAFDAGDARRNRRLKTVSDIVPWKPPAHQPASTPRKATPPSDSEVFEDTFGGKLTLEPGQKFQAVLQITKVYSDCKTFKKVYAQWLSDYIIPNDQGPGTTVEGAPPRPKPEITPIPTGKYSLSVSIILVTDSAETCVPSFDKWITIQLGEPGISKQKDTVMP